ncbi:TetR/AcrR family transcriptional regulator [Secundilactobacillus collinoides]|uniref:TetR/AcrR family transcriptional regulator n=1 Tax=Secundilactobacillus collinoides TaxID=33960 RepID=UPI000AA41BD3|nr:TetR family transcriptional regulator [Secundilactobacillus collinoides]
MATHQKIINTERKIKQAFIYLGNTKGLEKLTVSDVTKYAHINRSTFYAHYEDKIALTRHFEDEVLNKMHTVMESNLAETMINQRADDENLRTYPAVIQMIQFIHQEFDLIKVLMVDAQFYDAVKDQLRQIIDRDLFMVKGSTRMTAKLPDNYAHEIVLASILSVVQVWVHQGTRNHRKKFPKLLCECST